MNKFILVFTMLFAVSAMAANQETVNTDATEA